MSTLSSIATRSENYTYVHILPLLNSAKKPRKSRKGGGICIYVRKSLKFNVGDDINILYESVETLLVEILNKESQNIIITAAYRPTKGNNKLFKDFCKNILNKQKMSNKAAFLLDFNLNALDYHTNEVVKNFLNLDF